MENWGEGKEHSALTLTYKSGGWRSACPSIIAWKGYLLIGHMVQILSEYWMRIICNYCASLVITHAQSTFSTVWYHCFEMVPKDSSSPFNSCCSMHILCLEAHFAKTVNCSMQNEDSYFCLLQECLLSLYPAITNIVITSLSFKCWLVKSSSSSLYLKISCLEQLTNHWPVAH